MKKINIAITTICLLVFFGCKDEAKIDCKDIDFTINGVDVLKDDCEYMGQVDPNDPGLVATVSQDQSFELMIISGGNEIDDDWFFLVNEESYELINAEKAFAKVLQPGLNAVKLCKTRNNCITKYIKVAEADSGEGLIVSNDSDERKSSAKNSSSTIQYSSTSANQTSTVTTTNNFAAQQAASQKAAKQRAEEQRQREREADRLATEQAQARQLAEAAALSRQMTADEAARKAAAESDGKKRAAAQAEAKRQQEAADQARRAADAALQRKKEADEELRQQKLAAERLAREQQETNRKLEEAKKAEEERKRVEEQNRKAKEMADKAEQERKEKEQAQLAAKLKAEEAQRLADVKAEEERKAKAAKDLALQNKLKLEREEADRKAKEATEQARKEEELRLLAEKEATDKKRLADEVARKAAEAEKKLALKAEAALKYTRPSLAGIAAGSMCSSPKYTTGPFTMSFSTKNDIKLENVTVNAETRSTATLTLMDGSGKKLDSQSIQLPGGKRNINCYDFPPLKPGTYSLKIEGAALSLEDGSACANSNKSGYGLDVNYSGPQVFFDVKFLY